MGKTLHALRSHDFELHCELVTQLAAFITPNLSQESYEDDYDIPRIYIAQRRRLLNQDRVVLRTHHPAKQPIGSGKLCVPSVQI